MWQNQGKDHPVYINYTTFNLFRTSFVWGRNLDFVWRNFARFAPLEVLKKGRSGGSAVIIGVTETTEEHDDSVSWWQGNSHTEFMGCTWMSSWKLGSMVNQWVISPTYKWDILGYAIPRLYEIYLPMVLEWLSFMVNVLEDHPRTGKD